MSLLDFALMVVVVTASGALAPGPLFFANISKGSRAGARSGLLFSIGHTIVEFPLIMFLAMGLLMEANQPFVKTLTGLVGGFALVAFGVLQVLESRKNSSNNQTSKKGRIAQNSIFLGLVLTGLNPFFIVWWLTAGGKLIMEALALAQIYGVLMMFAAHIWMDYAWLIAVAYFSKLGVNLIGSKAYKVLLIVFGIILIWYGMNFILNSI